MGGLLGAARAARARARGDGPRRAKIARMLARRGAQKQARMRLAGINHPYRSPLSRLQPAAGTARNPSSAGPAQRHFGDATVGSRGDGGTGGDGDGGGGGGAASTNGSAPAGPAAAVCLPSRLPGV